MMRIWSTLKLLSRTVAQHRSPHRLLSRGFSMESAHRSKYDLDQIVRLFNHYADPKYAETWDNVGLLLEPTQKKVVKKILLTIDMTEEVMMEAQARDVNLIVTYHPLIFSPLKSITTDHWKTRIMARCFENHIAVYSPHTAWDNAPNCISDWLCSVLPHENKRFIHTNADNPRHGTGRIADIDYKEPVTLRKAIGLMKEYLNVPFVQVALGARHDLDSVVKTYAVCPGSGASVLKDVKADLYVTGEMSHHELWDAVQKHVTVILLRHSTSERGFLKIVPELFKETLPDVEFIVSTYDMDPLQTF